MQNAKYFYKGMMALQALLRRPALQRLICAVIVSVWCRAGAKPPADLLLSVALGILLLITVGSALLAERDPSRYLFWDGLVILGVMGACVGLVAGFAPVVGSVCLGLSSPWLRSQLFVRIPWSVPIALLALDAGMHGRTGLWDAIVGIGFSGLIWVHGWAFRNQPSDMHQAPYPISGRESEVGRLLIAGHTYKSIADELYVTEGTVKTYVWRMSRKLNAQGRLDLIQKLQSIL